MNETVHYVPYVFIPSYSNKRLPLDSFVVEILCTVEWLINVRLVKTKFH